MSKYDTVWTLSFRRLIFNNEKLAVSVIDRRLVRIRGVIPVL